MSELVEKIGNIAAKAGVEACWRQWLALTNESRPVEESHGNAIIDPESLVLMSLAVRQHERRLQDRVQWWARLGSPLVSVQRMQTLLGAYPASLGRELGWFAGACVDAGDRRWRKTLEQLGPDVVRVPARSGKGPDRLRLLAPSTLLLRLRAGFGVGAKADLLAFLIGIAEARMQRETWATAERIAQAISYASFSARRAAGDMVLARLVQASADRPTQYAIDREAWTKVLGLEVGMVRIGLVSTPMASSLRHTRESSRPPSATSTRLPAWRFWAQVFAFLAKCIEWSQETLKLSAVVQASRARDIVEKAGHGLVWNGIVLPDAQLYPGASYLKAFDALVDDVAAWVEASA